MRIKFISWLRAIGVILILLCHYVQQSSNQYLQLSAQFFNIGNDIFFIISGFCFGIYKNTEPVHEWYIKRGKRIFVPYEIMLAVLLAIHLILYRQINAGAWLAQFLGLHGWNGVEGAEQTWFITSILLCYLFTPIIEKLTIECSENRRGRNLILLFSMAPIIIIFCGSGIITDSSLYTPICWYALAYILGCHYYKFIFTRRKAMLAFVVMCVSFAIRLLGRNLLDGTIYYDSIIAGYTHVISAFCIFYIVAYIFKNCDETKPISILNELSFEIYLWHYMFTEGPVRLFGLTPYWITDCILVSIVTLVIAFVASRVERRIINLANR